MFAVVEISGHQEVVAEKDMIEVFRLPDAKEGETVTLDKVLCIFTPDGTMVEVGTPYLSGKTIKAKVIKTDVKDDKVVGVKFKRRKRYTRTFGHRQVLTKLQIEKL
jgi:large subunit ribosomal protein L21